MYSHWVLIANGSEARLYSMEKLSHRLTLLRNFVHTESRQKDERLASDRFGHFEGTTTGMAHGSFEEPSDPKEFEMERFAQELAAVLEEGRTDHQYIDLVIAASPRFHGILNKHLNEHVLRMVTTHIEKDYTKVPEHKLANTLSPYLH